MKKQGKVWGETSRIFDKNNVIIERIEIKKGTYCSEHKHHSRFNMFFLESGSVDIKIWKNDYDLVDTTKLKPKEWTVAPPGEFHQFVANEDSVVFEIYWVELDASDIERRSVGGKSE